MLYSAAGGILAGGVSTSLALMLDEITTYSILAIFLGVVMAGAVSSRDTKIVSKVAGIFLFYLSSAVVMYIHTAIFGSNALFGLIVLLFYFPVMVALYFVSSFLAGKIFPVR